MARQIRTIQNRETVKLNLHSVAPNRDPWVVEAILVGREGTGPDEKVTFIDAGDLREAQWSIYRHKGHWAWGSTGARVTVYEENPKPRKPRTTKAKAVTPKTAPIAQTKATTPTNGTQKRRPGRPRKNPVSTPVAAKVA